MRRLWNLILLGAVLLAQPFVFAQSTIVTASKVIDNTGALLSSGQLCIGTTCMTVTNGAIASKTITSTTSDVRVTNGGTITYLTLPSVTVSGSYWNFDNYVVPSTASISGYGTPRIACQAGAVYTETNGDQNKWVCVDINGVGTWNGVVPTPSGEGDLSSIALSLPSIFNVTGSPLTASGTITVTLADASANSVFAGPASGTASTPGFRPLVVADMPFSYSGNTTMLATVSGTLQQGVAITVDANGNLVGAGASTVIPGTINAAQVTGLASSATIDTTNASNITSGTLALARMPATTLSCATGYAMQALTLNSATPTCIPFQGVIASGLQHEVPIYSIAGGGTTLSASLVTIDDSGNLSTSGSLTGASLTLTGSVAQNQVFASPSGAAGAPGFRSITTADLPFSYSGNTTNLATVSGALTSGHGVTIDASGNLVDSGSASAGSTSLTNPGYSTLPGGLIMQWGFASTAIYGSVVTLPTSFPHACFGVSTTDNGPTDIKPFAVGATCTTSQINLYPGDGSSIVGTWWVALGY